VPDPIESAGPDPGPRPRRPRCWTLREERRPGGYPDGAQRRHDALEGVCRRLVRAGWSRPRPGSRRRCAGRPHPAGHRTPSPAALLGLAADALSGPGGLAARLRTALGGGPLTAASCPWTSAPPPKPSPPTCAARPPPATRTAPSRLRPARQRPRHPPSDPPRPRRPHQPAQPGSRSAPSTTSPPSTGEAGHRPCTPTALPPPPAAARPHPAQPRAAR
jgi:hypothetical protein